MNKYTYLNVFMCSYFTWYRKPMVLNNRKEFVVHTGKYRNLVFSWESVHCTRSHNTENYGSMINKKFIWKTFRSDKQLVML